MSLIDEIQKARTKIVSDGYEMSIGEIINLYKNEEIVINPEFQRLFRWDNTRKTRFIESLLLGIPIPPVFVYQRDSGVWELIDGLQRLSTIFEFVGILRKENGKFVTASMLEGTSFLPSLADRKWSPSEENTDDGIGSAQQLQIKRARLRVEILLQESDPTAKYELFQRLNTGGAQLSEQEVRNCIAVMLNKPFHDWLCRCATNESFLTTIDQTTNALERQSATELALRFFAFRNVPYKTGLDVHEYLDNALITMATNTDFDMSAEESVFLETFQLLSDNMGAHAFKRWDGTVFKGKFLMSSFEVAAKGISYNLSTITAHSNSDFIKNRCKSLWDDSTFQKYSGAGVSGSARLAKLLPLAESFFRP